MTVIYLSGGIKKDADERKVCWSVEDRETIRDVIGGDVEFLDPQRNPERHDPFAAFGLDLKDVKGADVIIVDGREKRGIGVGAEMLAAKIWRKPVVAIAPKNGHYRRDLLKHFGQDIEDWRHPFIFGLSDAMVESVEEAARWVKGFLGRPVPVKDSSVLDEAIGHLISRKETGMRIVLASKSPRRRLFLEMLGLDFEVMPSQVDERAVKESDPVRLARRLARLKAEDVAGRVDGDAVVIGADTLVSFQGRVIGKARSREDALRILRDYSGREHEQITGLCVINTRTGRVLEGHDITRGAVRELSDGDIEEYVETGEPLEGAGAYTPRFHTRFFERIDGSWTNVVGLPMEKLVPMLGESLRDTNP
jgi:septum formation protein